MHTISIDLPDLPKGTEVEVDGLGKFENGYTYDITDEQADYFRIKHQTLHTELGENGSQQNSIVLGLSLEEAFADHPYIKVAEGKVAKVKKASTPTNDDPEGSEN